MNQILNRVVLKDKIEIRSSVEKFKKYLNDSKGRKYNVEWISDTEFKFLSTSSEGVLMMDAKPGFFDGIKGYGTINELGAERVEITLSSKPKIELYFFLAIFIAAFLVAMYLEKDIPIWIYFLLPICLVWFWWVLRGQENLLFYDVIPFGMWFGTIPIAIGNDFIMGKAKAKICFDASVSQQIFNAEIAHNLK